MSSRDYLDYLIEAINQINITPPKRRFTIPPQALMAEGAPAASSPGAGLLKLRLAVARVHLLLLRMQEVVSGECGWNGERREWVLASCELLSEETGQQFRLDCDKASEALAGLDRSPLGDSPLGDSLRRLENLGFKVSSVVTTLVSMLRDRAFRPAFRPGQEPDVEATGACHLCDDVLVEMFQTVEAVEGIARQGRGEGGGVNTPEESHGEPS